jgi:hypothetical protein
MRSAICITLLALSACGGTPPADAPDDIEAGSAAKPKRGGGMPMLESEVGALDQDKVNEAVTAAAGDVEGCFKRANDGLDYPIIGGDVEMVIRVKSDGGVRWSHPSSSSLGHLDTERCILDALGKQDWPKPEGGEEGIARVPFGIDPPGRPPVDWSASSLGPNGSKLQSKLRGCKSGSALTVTMYVDPDGKVIAAGASVDDETGIDAITCAVDAAKSLRYASPGSYPAKVSLRLE